MERKMMNSSGSSSRVALNLYIAICAIIVLIILLAPFRHSTADGQDAEIYLRTSVSEINGQ